MAAWRNVCRPTFDVLAVDGSCAGSCGVGNPWFLQVQGVAQLLSMCVCALHFMAGAGGMHLLDLLRHSMCGPCL